MTYAATLEELGRLVGRTVRGVTRLRGMGAPVRAEGKKGFPVEPLREWMAARAMGTTGLNMPRAPRLEVKKGKRSAPAPAPTAAKPAANFDELLKVKTSLANAQASEREAKAALAQLLLKERLGEVVPREEVRRSNVTKFTTISTRLLSLPRDCSLKLENRCAADIERALDKEIRAVLEVLSQQ